ncbi:MAG: hypothetical protein SFV55_21400 [Haliscomenobacter sp.]|uniref:hypothetical protein n=1 Tax=Haliscomenobacter sp. TaxID=2717303 RepID=UPI0029B40BED|nr:hypothetical protein [Haliscomenobacter sp.]MDX2071000.1 hypothetical protein [Haliscomenobacter sp.]
MSPKSKPNYCRDGLVVGIWKRTVQKNKVVVEVEFFDLKDALELRVMEKVVAGFGKFLGLEVVVRATKKCFVSPPGGMIMVQVVQCINLIFKSPI